MRSRELGGGGIGAVGGEGLFGRLRLADAS